MNELVNFCIGVPCQEMGNKHFQPVFVLSSTPKLIPWSYITTTLLFISVKKYFAIAIYHHFYVSFSFFHSLSVYVYLEKKCYFCAKYWQCLLLIPGKYRLWSNYSCKQVEVAVKIYDECVDCMLLCGIYIGCNWYCKSYQ